MMVDTQHKVSRYVRFIEQLVIVLTWLAKRIVYYW